MKQFCRKCVILSSILIMISVVFNHLASVEPWRRVIARITGSLDYISVNTGTDEIKPYIEDVQRNDGSTQLILGDSVCNQLFRELREINSNISIVSSNAGITMTGQYILAHEYIKNHKNATDIYLFVLPGSLTGTFDLKYGYQYAVMPFVATNTLNLLDDNTLKIMEKVYGKFFMKPEVVEIIDKSAVNRKLYLNMIKKNSSGYQQSTAFEIADQYIKKMYELCEANGIKLHLYPCPMPESRKEYVRKLEIDYNSSWLKSKFPDYFDNILYYQDEYFPDGVHFGGEFANRENYNEIIQEMANDSNLLNELKWK